MPSERTCTFDVLTSFAAFGMFSEGSSALTSRSAHARVGYVITYNPHFLTNHVNKMTYYIYICSDHVLSSSSMKMPAWFPAKVN